MKFDELKADKTFVFGEECEAYKKSDVDELLAEKDAAIAELKQKLEAAEADAAETLALLEERNRQVGELNAKLDSMTQQFSKYVVDANNRERSSKRALWIARAERVQDKQTYYTHMRGDGWVHGVDQWIEVERKCFKKAEEYK